jgi:hypothetical protein
VGRGRDQVWDELAGTGRPLTQRLFLCPHPPPLPHPTPFFCAPPQPTPILSARPRRLGAVEQLVEHGVLSAVPDTCLPACLPACTSVPSHLGLIILLCLRMCLRISTLAAVLSRASVGSHPHTRAGRRPNPLHL